jgi:ketosteroid isomerase-like protein
MADSRGQVFRDALEVFVKGDNEAWREVVPELFDPEVEWRPALATHVYHGHEGAVRWVEVMTSGFADFRADADVIEEHGDRFLTLHRFHGVHVASGVVVERKIGIVWEFRGDRCIRVTGYFGWDEARSAAGEDFAKPAAPAG